MPPPSADGPAAPSTQQSPDRHIPTIDELRRLAKSFGAAAARAAKGSVDGVELHSHESFLHAQMLNPLWNTRDDEYGGSLDNRMRFLIETLTAMREAIGDKPLGVRLKLDDMAQRGMTSDEYAQCVQKLEALKLIDYINVTGGDGRFHHGPMPRPEGEWLPLVRDLRAKTKLVIMHAGRIATPQMAEDALKQGWLDIACMTKSHICDPHLTRKAEENRLDDIRYCTRCLQACHGHMETMTCVYNPLTSRELKWSKLEPAATRKRIVIVGAGPAGMECAVNAAARGHEVIVLEKSSQVGGQVLLGAASPLRKNWARIAEFYTRQAAKRDFEVRLNTKATAEVILNLKADAVVIATGSTPARLRLRDGSEALTVHECLTGKADNAKHAIIYDKENFNRPLVAADYLSARGTKVELVSPLNNIGGLVEGMMLEEMVAQLTQRGVRFHASTELVARDKESVTLRDTRANATRTIENIDIIIATVGSSPINDLAAALHGKVANIHVIGDAKSPQNVEAATTQGAELARQL
jgi:thioredoxin reductase